MIYFNENGILIRDLQQCDAQILVKEELAQGWDPGGKYEMRLKD